MILIVKVIGIGVVVTVAALIVKQFRPDIAMLISIAGGIVLLLLVLGQFTSIFAWLTKLTSSTGIDNSLIAPILKIVGIGYLAEFAATACDDAGNKSMANKIVLAAKIVILVLSLPVLSILVETIVGVL